MRQLSSPLHIISTDWIILCHKASHASVHSCHRFSPAAALAHMDLPENVARVPRCISSLCCSNQRPAEWHGCPSGLTTCCTVLSRTSNWTVWLIQYRRGRNNQPILVVGGSLIFLTALNKPWFFASFTETSEFPQPELPWSNGRGQLRVKPDPHSSQEHGSA